MFRKNFVLLEKIIKKIFKLPVYLKGKFLFEQYCSKKQIFLNFFFTTFFEILLFLKIILNSRKNCITGIVIKFFGDGVIILINKTI
jgi:hypothetical protein